MGSGGDGKMDTKIPAALWKTQLLKLVSEAPKAICIESLLGFGFGDESSSGSGSSSSSQNVLLNIGGPKEVTSRDPWDQLLFLDSGIESTSFGKAFHGNLTLAQANQLLRKDGEFLVRKKDGDSEFILSLRFNGSVKNFIVSSDDGLFYVGGRDKGFENLKELVQEGLVTLYLDQKAGSYIDLMVDLTEYHHSNGVGGSNGLGGTLTLMRTSGSCRANNGSHRNSPSPSISTLSRSSMERRNVCELKLHSFEVHTFEGLSRCQICQNFLWGLSSQGLQCKDCTLSVHELCEEKVLGECLPKIELIKEIFTCDLRKMVKAGGGKIPFVLVKCIKEIELRGLQLEGIYRVSGSRELIERLKTYLENDRDESDLSSHADIHSMCGVVKLYLRLLPSPLISPEVFQRFLTVNGVVSLETLKKNLRKLPPANELVLKFLLQHLHRVAEMSEKNKMNAFNLSSVFTPTVLCPNQISLSTLKIGTSVLENMINYVPNIYPYK